MHQSQVKRALRRAFRRARQSRSVRGAPAPPTFQRPCRGACFPDDVIRWFSLAALGCRAPPRPPFGLPSAGFSLRSNHRRLISGNPPGWGNRVFRMHPGKRERTLPACRVRHPCRMQGEGGGVCRSRRRKKVAGAQPGASFRQDAGKDTLEACAPTFLRAIGHFTR